MNRVVLTAGYDRASHVLTLAEMLRRDGVLVQGLLVVSPYNTKRLRSLLRQRGRGFIWEALPRLLGRSNGRGKRQEPDELAELMEQQGLRPRSLRSWATEYGVPYRSVKSINADEAIGFVASIRPDWVVYGGGGILHDGFIDAAGGRILNAHSGPLPEIRGMNACEWSLLLGHAPAVTIHLINRGIDTGGILSEHLIPVERGDTVESLRSRCVATGVQALHETVLHPPEILPEPMKDAAVQRQCFVLAPALYELLEKRLKQGDVPALHARRPGESA